MYNSIGELRNKTVEEINAIPMHFFRRSMKIFKKDLMHAKPQTRPFWRVTFLLVYCA